MKIITSTFWSTYVQPVCLITGLTLSLGASALQMASNYTTGTRYNLNGQVVGTISPDPDGGGPLPSPATRITYNSQGLPVKTESGALANWQAENVLVINWPGFAIATIQEVTYDDVGQKIIVTTRPPTSSTPTTLTQYSYDDYGRVSCKTERMNPAVFGSLPASACTLGTEGSFGPDRITSYEYENTFGQVKIERRAVGTPLEQKYVTNQYDFYGRLTDQYDANNNQTHLEYYADTDLAQAGKLKRMYFPNKAVATSAPYSATDYEEYTYDANGNRKTLRKRDTKVITYTYDNLNRVTTKDIPNGTANDVTFTYDLLGLQTSATFGSGKSVSATFDGFGLVETETADINGVNKTVSHTYDYEGNRLRMTHPDVHFFDYSYDGLNRLTRIKDEWGTTLIFNKYDNFARAESQSTTGGALTTLGYDSVSRLGSIDFQASGTVFDRFQSFGYNAANQVTDLSISNDLYQYKEQGSKTGTYSVNGLNQYTSVGTKAYTYDANGNLLSDTDTTYSYDVENRLTSASGARNVSLAYDPKGRLNVVTANGQSTFFLYSGDSLIAEYTTAKVGKRYVFGTGVDKPLVTYAADYIGSDNRSFLHSNHQGSIVALTDNTGTVRSLNTYDTYGVPDSTVKSRFAYTGQAYIPELGMYYYKARIYEPKMGRFLQTDPIGYKDDMDLYSYVGNDPLNRTDPTGTEGTWDDMKAGAAAEQHFYLTGEGRAAPNNAAGYSGVVINALGRSTSMGLTVGTFRVPMAKGPGIVITPSTPKAGTQGASGTLTTASGNSYHGNSTGSSATGGDARAPMNPQVQGALDKVENPSRTHGFCCEIDAANKALNAGDSVKGAEMGPVTLNESGKTLEPCSTCREIMKNLGMKQQ